jgi:hypothetical protein
MPKEGGGESRGLTSKPCSNTKYDFTIDINAADTINSLNIPIFLEVNNDTSSDEINKPQNIKIRNSKTTSFKEIIRDLSIYYKTDNMDTPKVICQNHLLNKNISFYEEIACIISVNPTFD